MRCLREALVLWPCRIAYLSYRIAPDVKGCALLDNPQVLALCSSFLFGLALVLTQFGLTHVPPNRGASISIPTSAVLFSALAPFMLDWDGWDPRGALIFVLVGLLFPATVTLLTFEANRRMGPSIAGALSNLTPLFAVVVAAFLLNEVPRPLQALGIANGRDRRDHVVDRSRLARHALAFGSDPAADRNRGNSRAHPSDHQARPRAVAQPIRGGADRLSDVEPGRDRRRRGRQAPVAERESPRWPAVVRLRRGLQWSRRPRVVLGAGARPGAFGVAARCDLSARDPGVCRSLASLGARHDRARHRRDDHGRGRHAAGRDVKRHPAASCDRRTELTKQPTNSGL